MLLGLVVNHRDEQQWCVRSMYGRRSSSWIREQGSSQVLHGLLYFHIPWVNNSMHYCTFVLHTYYYLIKKSLLEILPMP